MFTSRRHQVRLNCHPRTAFTLVELLVVIAIIGVLVALLLPAIQAAREAARRADCGNRMRQIGIAFHNYESAKKSIPFGSLYPTAGTTGSTAAVNVWVGPQNLGWRGRMVPWNWVPSVMPYMEMQNVVDRLNMTPMPAGVGGLNDWLPGSAQNAPLVTSLILPQFVCPSDPDAANPLIPYRKISGSILEPLGDVPQHGLWYTASIGPTRPDHCRFSEPLPAGMAATQASQVCMGSNFGSSEVIYQSACFLTNSCPQTGRFVGMFGRTTDNIKFRQVSDGLSNTIMVGETIPSHWRHNSLWGNNFPLSSTHIPLNSLHLQDDLVTLSNDPDYGRTSGYKSHHPGGAHLLMGDATVHYVTEDIDYLAYNALGSTSAGETNAQLPN